MMSKAAKLTLPTWARVLAAIVGIVSLCLGLVVLVYPGLAILTLVFLLATAFLFIGIDRLMAGITGHPYYWLAPMTSLTSAPGATSGATPSAPK
jgi:uncharacterized membrane protein HdeD (DUF308 family)